MVTRPNIMNNSNNIINGIRLSVVDLPKLPARHLQTAPKSAPPPVEMKENCEKNKKAKRNEYVTMFIAELLGTGLLMFFGCMGCITQVDNPPAVHQMSSLSFGLVIMIIIQLFGHISGAHLNPAVTFCTVIMKMISPKMGVVYTLAQFIGATLGFGLLKLLTPAEYTEGNFCATTPHRLTSATQTLVLETILTAVLIMICCSVWDKRNADKPDSVPLRFGLAIAAISMVAGPFSGASMNTARSFAPIVYSRQWENQWVYWIGPNVGALIGCFLYKYVFAIEEEEEDSTKEEQIRLEEVTGGHKA